MYRIPTAADIRDLAADPVRVARLKAELLDFEVRQAIIYGEPVDLPAMAARVDRAIATA